MDRLCNASHRPRPCCSLGDMLVEDVILHAGLKFGRNGYISPSALPDAREYFLETIADLENSPAGPSTRNRFVLSLLRAAVTGRLRRAAAQLNNPVASRRGATLEALRAAAARRPDMESEAAS